MRPVPPAMAVKLNRAADLIADRGYDQTTIDDIAESSGVPKATLYYYFSGKDEIMSFLLNDVVSSMSAAVGAAYRSEGSSWDRLVAVIVALIDVLADHPAVCRALYSDIGKAGRMPDIIQSVFESFYQPVETLLASGEQDGSLQAVGDVPALTRIIFGAISLASLSYLLAGEPVPRQQLSGELTRLLSTGIRGN